MLRSIQIGECLLQYLSSLLLQGALTVTSIAPQVRIGINLADEEHILFKITLSNKSLVPAGIREIERESDKVIDRRNADKAIAAGNARVATVGRVRPGRVDTGKPIFQNVERVRVSLVRGILARKGFRLADAHFFVRNDGKAVLVLSLMKGRDTLELPRATVEAIRAMARDNVWTADMWENVDNATLNFRARQQGSAKQSITVDDDMLMMVDGDLAVE